MSHKSIYHFINKTKTNIKKHSKSPYHHNRIFLTLKCLYTDKKKLLIFLFVRFKNKQKKIIENKRCQTIIYLNTDPDKNIIVPGNTRM